MSIQDVSLSMPSRAPSWRIKALAFASDNKLFVFGALLLLLIILAAVFAPWLAPYEPNKIVFSQKLLAPNWAHWMGTDEFGRDILSRVLYGARTSLIIGVSVTLIAMLIGIPIGLVSGYFGGRVDTLLMRLSDVFLAFPPLLLPIAITAALGSGLANAMLALAVSWFPWYARIMRGAVVRVRSETYIHAARSMGVSHGRILLRHVLPNATTPVIVQGSMDFGYTILAAASLSFIGLGAKPPMVEWGLMAAASRSQLLENPWTVLFPGVAIFVLVLAVNLVGDGLRDVLDPKKGTR
ncbi:D-ala-D-ala transporter subunit [Pseudomonas ogarae]|uniref:D-ala-D-ala transporter subunit n=1 Tax=Pseudomonas kilonensis TaxID=132476 RepID=A0A0F4XVI5_9PSED|nr:MULTISPECIES: ABC transporter permease [Pseudomonas]KKA09830.1 D-ala-D-ala transporter subunit [Pseudomonas ogarae]OPG71485.1 D-ala-D-ala transporter subunit [Pseudomonas ogarae]OPG81022.1 D-ala-D-ala transporter subunit [Pseudomonas ogarae]PBJ16580.1 putative D,D-dipeptide transport system permease protein DdpC [Pseudomonas ogarae]PBJ22349.1 putative D,D-dipeptide transport system permease protein DdpC [Pseudomonas ogarae]